MNQREIIEAMEVCRSTADFNPQEDLPELAAALEGDAELRQRCERILQWDEVLGDSLHAVPVPEGLGARLLQGLDLDGSAPSPSLQVHRRSRLRRGLWWAASLSVVALVLVAVLLNPLTRETPQLTAEFAEEIIDWTQVVSQSDWRADFAASELQNAPFDRRIQAIPQRWTSIETRYAPQTIVFDLAQRRGEPAYLFCFASGRSSLPASPPNMPFSTTGGYSIGAWQHGDHVYVLAIRGGERKYRSMIQSAVILGWIDRTFANRLIGQV